MLQKTCPSCQGTGRVPNERTGDPCVCPVCQGEGRVAAPVTRRLYFYVVNAVIAAGSGQLNVQLNIDSRAPFEVYALTGNRTGAYTFQITDQTGRTWQSAAVNDANAVGTAQQLFPLPVPIVLAASASLNILFIDTSAAPNTIQLVLCGYELYPEA
jgi:hypothetical protein